jgi:hypothetical protein
LCFLSPPKDHPTARLQPFCNPNPCGLMRPGGTCRGPKGKRRPLAGPRRRVLQLPMLCVRARC